MLVRGALTYLKPRYTRQAYGMDLVLKGEQTWVVHDPDVRIPLWVDSTQPELVDALVREGYGAQIVSRWTPSGRRELTEVRVRNPQYDRAAVRQMVGAPEDTRWVRNPGEVHFPVWGSHVPAVAAYLVTAGLAYFAPVEAAVEEHEGRLVAREVRRVEGQYTPTMLAWDIEVYNKGGMPDHKDPVQPIIMISAFDGEEHLFSGMDERALLKEFAGYLESRADRDLLVGYNADGFDFPYFRGRAARLEVPLPFGLDQKGIRRKRGGTSWIHQIFSMHDIDLYQFLPRLYLLPRKSLGAALQLFFSHGKDLDARDIWQLWDREDLAPLEAYARGDTRRLYQLCDHLGIPDALSVLSALLGVSPEEITRKPAPVLLDHIARRKYYRSGGVWMDAARGDQEAAAHPVEAVDARVPRGRIVSVKHLPAAVLADEPPIGIEGIIPTLARDLLEGIKRYPPDGLPGWTSTVGRSLADLAAALPLLYERPGPWLDLPRARRTWAAVDAQIRTLGDEAGAVYRSRNILAAPDPPAGPDERAEFGGIPLLTSSKGTLLFAADHQLYTRGFTLPSKSAAPAVRETVEAVARAAVEVGIGAARTILVERLQDLPARPHEDFVYLHRGKDALLAADGPAPPDQEPDVARYREQILDRLDPVFQSFGRSARDVLQHAHLLF